MLTLLVYIFKSIYTNVCVRIIIYIFIFSKTAIELESATKTINRLFALMQSQAS